MNWHLNELGNALEMHFVGGECKRMSDKILKEITSGDPDKIWRSSCGIIDSSQNSETIISLVSHLEEIRNATRGIDLGGGFAPNRRFLDYAIRIIEYYKNNNGNCPCVLYLDKYECNDPEREENKGNITIENTEVVESMICYYACRCAKCGQRYNVKERFGHYTFWFWDIIV